MEMDDDKIERFMRLTVERILLLPDHVDRLSVGWAWADRERRAHRRALFDAEAAFEAGDIEQARLIIENATQNIRDDEELFMRGDDAA
jgi:hypothetical protein